MCRCYIIAQTQEWIRIAGGYHFPSISANYAHPIIEASASSFEAGSLFSRTCETRFRYRRRVLFILRSATTVRKRCHTSLPVSLWFADSRIPGESANSAVLDCASALSGIPIPPYFYWHWLVGPASINFRKYMKIHRGRVHKGAIKGSRRGWDFEHRLWCVSR